MVTHGIVIMFLKIGFVQNMFFFSFCSFDIGNVTHMIINSDLWRPLRSIRDLTVSDILLQVYT